jgi:2-oxo-4-hydroxy-4-carboxy-5-ureidoimidazoline decarboxylase
MSGQTVALAKLNGESLQGFLGVCGPLFEHSPWVAARTWARRPFASLSALHRELVATVEKATTEEKVALICAHPDLVGRLAGRTDLTLSVASAREQSAAGMASLSQEEAGRFRQYNEEYHKRFGFPFVICARENRKEAILEAFPRRLVQSREQEIANGLSEIAKIAWLRLKDAVTEE